MVIVEQPRLQRVCQLFNEIDRMIVWLIMFGFILKKYSPSYEEKYSLLFFFFRSYNLLEIENSVLEFCILAFAVI